MSKSKKIKDIPEIAAIVDHIKATIAAYYPDASPVIATDRERNRWMHLSSHSSNTSFDIYVGAEVTRFYTASHELKPFVLPHSDPDFLKYLDELIKHPKPADGPGESKDVEFWNHICEAFNCSETHNC